MERLRVRMVKTQIEGRGIVNADVLAALQKVERHRFVPERYVSEAYSDHPLPIGEGQTISQPYIVAFMTEVLKLKRSDKVLEIGTGSGYQAAILGELCDSVYTIEIVEVLGKQAAKLLDDLGYDNIQVMVGDGYKGWPEYAPFDAIIVTCSPTEVPKPLQEQLAEGGRMVIPVGERYAQELVLLTKRGGKLRKDHILPVRFVPMVDSTGTTY
ncbi:MAG: protein-L-isoaspartate(D-aspartate) O-methyltransferase [Candidatus Latescibacteria bacterium]|nr:protein-L-isoaspartate(D-aspartate) O-methyltransferase [Candidatus Latescibacterota bacterium]